MYFYLFFYKNICCGYHLNCLESSISQTMHMKWQALFSLKWNMFSFACLIQMKTQMYNMCMCRFYYCRKWTSVTTFQMHLVSSPEQSSVSYSDGTVLHRPLSVNNWHLLLNHWANLDQTSPEWSLRDTNWKLFRDLESKQNSACHSNK